MNIDSYLSLIEGHSRGIFIPWYSQPASHMGIPIFRGQSKCSGQGGVSGSWDSGTWTRVVRTKDAEGAWKHQLEGLGKIKPLKPSTLPSIKNDGRKDLIRILIK